MRSHHNKASNLPYPLSLYNEVAIYSQKTQYSKGIVHPKIVIHSKPIRSQGPKIILKNKTDIDIF